MGSRMSFVWGLGHWMSVSTSHREKADPRKELILGGGTGRLLDVLDLSVYERFKWGMCVFEACGLSENGPLG